MCVERYTVSGESLCEHLNGFIQLFQRSIAMDSPVVVWPVGAAMQLAGDHSIRPGCDITSLKQCIDYVVMNKVTEIIPNRSTKHYDSGTDTIQTSPSTNAEVPIDEPQQPFSFGDFTKPSDYHGTVFWPQQWTEPGPSSNQVPL